MHLLCTRSVRTPRMPTLTLALTLALTLTLTLTLTLALTLTLTLTLPITLPPTRCARCTCSSPVRGYPLS